MVPDVWRMTDLTRETVMTIDQLAINHKSASKPYFPGL
jgi:hypothetical protein